MTDWYAMIYKAFIYSSIIAFIIGWLSDSKTSLGAYIAGYSVFSLAILMILVILFANILKSPNHSSLQILYSILMTTGPFILILGTISFVLYLLIKYNTIIIENKVAPGYNSFSNIIVFLLLIQTYIIMSNTDNTSGGLSKVNASMLYLIGTVTAICSVILYTILKYYSTDGFSSLINSNKFIS